MSRTVGDRIAEDLRGAAGLLNRDGWCRGHHHDQAGAHDLLGAIYAATGYHTLRDGRWVSHPLCSRRAVDCRTWLQRRHPARTMAQLNDADCASAEQAVGVLLDAASAAAAALRSPRDVERLLS